MERKQFLGLTQNQLKVIGAISMAVDHVGVELLPQFYVLRIIGRLAFPIFSFFIYEGCRYTHNKPGYFLRIFLLGLVCAVGYFIYCGDVYGNVLITFSMSICLVYCIQFFKRELCQETGKKIRGFLLFTVCVLLIWSICKMAYVDYGFCGVLLPALAEIFDWESDSRHKMLLPGFGAGLVWLSVQMGGIQYWSLISLILLAAYNGKRGKANMKYFFYWFYPIHLLIIGGISMIL